MFEHRHAPLISRREYRLRLLKSIGLAVLLVFLSLLLGTTGYHVAGNLPWLDALLNASMILTGMGPVDPMTTAGGKLFATFYALFSGVIFLSCVAVVIAPVFHRFLHRFHLESPGDR